MIFLLHVLFALSLTHATTLRVPSLEELRVNYEKAVTDKNTCAAMIRSLGTEPQSPVYRAYLGGYQAIWANHIGNPLKRLATFNDGRANIDQAAKDDPRNLDIRFIRLSVQQNAPRILGYARHIEEDRKFLKQHKENISSPTLRVMIEHLLRS